MNEMTYIGLSRPDGIRYITVMNGDNFEENGRILKNFYRKENRVERLLELGDLLSLGSSPYNPSDDRSRPDTLHCQPLGNGKAHTVKDKESFFLLGEWTYLYENGKWQLGHGGNIHDISRTDFSIFVPDKNRIPPAVDNRIKFFFINSQGALEFMTDFTGSWDTWETLQDKVNAKGMAVYVFRETELIKILEPKNINS